MRLDTVAGEWVPASGEDIEAAQQNPFSAALVSAGAALSFNEQPEAINRESPVAAFLGRNAPFEIAGVGGAIGARLLRGSGMAARTGARVAAADKRLARDFGDVVRGQNPGIVRGALGQAADQVQAAGQALPGLRAVAAIPAERRGAQINAAVVRAMGGSPDDILQNGRLTRRGLDQVVTQIEKKFDDAIDQRARINIGRQLAEEVDAIRSLPKAERRLFPQTLEGEITGRQFKNFRQKLQKIAVGKDEVRGDIAREAVKKLDAVAEQSGAVNRELYKQARQQYRVWLALKKGRGFSKESVNVPSFRSNLENIYGNEFRLQRTGGQSDEIAELLEMVAEAENLGTAIPSSGTAERLLGAGALAGGAYLATQ